MSRRIGQLTHVEEYIDVLPPPASYVPKIQAEIRVFYPPNASLDHVLALIDRAYYAAIDNATRDFYVRAP